ncbi:MAG: hypothetical protein NC033_01405 [Clostridiales bacterium]|nr:hypothetical protein [Clostridiales bacterium]
MKKKVIIAALATICAVSGLAALTACDNGGGSGHTHDYDLTKWVSVDDEYHAHPCKHEGCTSVSGAERHDEQTEITATCTDDGEEIITCSVEGCPYEKRTPKEKLGHDWDLEDPDAPTHTHGGTLKCKREGCNVTQESGTLPHNVGESEDVNNFTVYTCEDCGTEVADFKISVLTTGTGDDANKQVAYTKESVTVTLYEYTGGEHVKVAEADTDAATGIALFKIPRGTYLVGVDNGDHSILCNEAVEAVFLTDKDHENAVPQAEIHIGSKREHTYTIYYGDGTDHPAEGVKVDLVPQTSVKNPLTIATGTTDANGAVTFEVSDNFASVTTNGVTLKISGYDTENYYYTLLDSVRVGTAHDIEAHLYPKTMTHTVIVTAGEDKAVGVKVKLTNTVYNSETKEFEDEVIAEGVTDTNGAFTTEQALDNTLSYKIVIDLEGSEYEETYKVPASIPNADSLTGERTVNLVKKDPTYIFWLSEQLAGIKFIVKNSEGTVVAEGETDAEGKYRVALPFAEYQLIVDNEALLAQNYTADSVIKTVPTVGTNGKTTLKSDNTVDEGLIWLSAIVSKSVTVKYGTEVLENVVVKIYLDGELAFTSAPTAADGTTTLKFINRSKYEVVLEGDGMPENTVCGTGITTLKSTGTTNISVVDSANLNLILKDIEGNALSGAKVTLYTYSGSTGKVTETAAASGVTAADGTVSIHMPIDEKYYIGVIGEDGTNYWCNNSVTATTKGENVSLQLSMYTYDTAVYTTTTGGFDTAKTELGKDILTLIYKQDRYSRTDEFTFGDLAVGKYTITINPDDYDFTYEFKFDYDSGWGTVVGADEVADNDYLVFHKDDNGRITSIEWMCDGTSATWFRFMMSATADGEYHKLTVRLDKVEE